MTRRHIRKAKRKRLKPLFLPVMVHQYEGRGRATLVLGGATKDVAEALWRVARTRPFPPRYVKTGPKSAELRG